MKKIYYLLMAAVAVMCVCSSCSKDEDGDVDSKSIVGTWNVVSEEGYAIYDGEKEEWKETYGGDESLITTFNADGTGSAVYRDEYIEDTIGKFNWKLNGNKLSIKFAGDVVVEECRVEKLTSTTLVVVYEWISSDGMEKEYNKTIFTRIM
ncbi:MAG: lipocalin family protein [Alistipes sp.]|nr:lipocalin family protein [Alistipes sp.]